MTNEEKIQYEKYRILKADEKFHGTLKLAMEKWYKRSAIWSERIKAVQKLVPLGKETSGHVMSMAMEMFPNRKNWEYPKPTKINFPEWVHVQSINHGNYSSRCSYTHYTYSPMIQSWANVTKFGLIFHYGKEAYQRINVKKGYIWGIDSNGIFLKRESTGDKYHVDSDDLQNGFKYVAARLRELAANRRKEKKEEKKRERALKFLDKLPIYVCKADSIAAHNCPAGTASFISRHNLNHGRTHIKADILLTIGKDDSVGRVKATVLKAKERLAQELVSGYSDLHYHGII